MVSIGFPKMLNSANTVTVTDHEATLQNLLLLLGAERRSLLGDPFFGVALKRIIFEQNTAVLRDLIVDEIYSSILTFMPQIQLKRKNIEVTSDGVDVYASISCLNLIDYQTDLYTINLTESGE